MAPLGRGQGMASVSVAMATFNGARFIGGQLLSIAKQTQLPDELVICDDGSTDETLELIEEFGRSAPFHVRVFRNAKRLGYRNNFLKAAQRCQGELVAFCDQDDIWHEKKIQSTAAAFKKSDVLLVFHNATVVNRKRLPVAQTFHRLKPRIYQPLEFSPWKIVPGFSQTFHRSLLKYSDLHSDSLDIYSRTEGMPHDQWFLFLASVLGSIAYIPNHLAVYRQHESNCSGWLPARPFEYVMHSILHARYYAGSASLAIANRLSLLEALRQRCASNESIEAAIDYYSTVQRYVDLRGHLYASKSLRARIRSISSLVRDGAYTKSQAELGLDNLVLDMFVGLTFGHALRDNLSAT